MSTPADDFEADHELDEDDENYCMWDHMPAEEAAVLRFQIAEFARAVERCARAVEEEKREEVERLEAIWRLPAIPAS